MIISSDVFEAYLKCASKCWSRFHGEEAVGNMYAQWVREKNLCYRIEALKRLLEKVHRDDYIVAPSQPVNIKMAKWRLAIDFVVQKKNLETTIQAIERLSSEDDFIQIIPIRFVFTNKITKDDRLLLAFDALVLSAALGYEVSLGRIIHGDDLATLKVKTSALAGEVWKRIEKITALLSSHSAPDLILNRHCTECEFQARCRQKAIEVDDLSLLSGMTEKERSRYRSKGIFTVNQLS